jgi:hypothetical protein
MFSTFSLKRQINWHFRNISIIIEILYFFQVENNYLEQSIKVKYFIPKTVGSKKDQEERLHQGGMVGPKTVLHSSYS